MKKIGIFYGSNSGNTEEVAQRIQQEIGEDKADVYDISRTPSDKMLEYDNLIFGLSTWGDGDYQDDWAGFVMACDKEDLSHKAIALFGLGDQENYPNSFVDALGKLYKRISTQECKMIGEWPMEGYDFKHSKAVKDNKFVGLVIDEDVQSDKTNERIKKWVSRIIKEFN